MLCPKAFYEELRHQHIDFFTGVPDSLLKSLCGYISDNVSSEEHIIAANEGGAIALGIGYYFATGKLPLIYMQNSGLGNAINPLLSLAAPEIYSTPMLLVLGWRGQPNVKDEPQHVKQGKVMLDMLKAMDIPFCVLSHDFSQAQSQLENAIKIAKQQSCPYAIVVEKDTFEPYSYQKQNMVNVSLTREEAIELIVEHLNPQAAVVATTGMASRELFELRKKKGSDGQNDFLTIGGMGHASQIALGLALNQKQKNVVCIDGDGAVLMHMGALALIGQLQCPNFTHIVINNGAHDSVGGQPTACTQLDLSAVAKACGYQHALSASTAVDITKQLLALSQLKGPTFLEIRTKKGSRKDLGRPTSTPAENKDKFMSFLQCV
jgi:phosphonopyruvate decarboxylase